MAHGTTDAVLVGENFDLQIGPDGDIVTADFFDTAILMSIFCERRAGASEVPESERRRGWIGNESTPGFEIGSKLWLYYQARVTRSILSGLESVVRDGLQWMVDDGIMQSFEVAAELRGGRVIVDIPTKRPSSKVEHRYYDLWENTGTR